MPIEEKQIVIYLIFIAVIFSVVLIFIFSFFSVFKKKQKINQLEKNQLLFHHQQQLMQTQIEIQEQTLKTISQEIHDNVAQVLSLAKLHLNTFPGCTDEQLAKVENTRDLVGKAITDLRNLSRSLYGDRIAEIGLQQSIEDELGILQNIGCIHTEMKITGTPYMLSPEKELVIFRMAQEALHNAIKHSGGKMVSVHLHYDVSRFSLEIKDDGDGFDVNNINKNMAGIGLKSMQNRSEMIGGTFEISSANDTGTSIRFKLLNPFST